MLDSDKETLASRKSEMIRIWLQDESGNWLLESVAASFEPWLD